eukprot:g11560.t1
MAQLIPGALVQVSGTYEEVIEVGEAVEILGRVSVDGPAQLLRREGPQWLALSFAGQLIRVDQPRPLNAVDDFVLGPGSNSEVLADAMASQLIMDGYCESRALNLRSEEPGSGERETFMSLVKRRRVCMMHFLGPRTGTLKLLPRADRPEITIEATPGKLVMFLTERFRYSHTCSGRTTTLQTWLLGQRPEYVMQGFGGDMSVLAPLAESGVPPPKGESVTVTGIATAIGGDSKDWGRAGTDTAVKTPITRYDLNVYYMDVDNMAEAQAEGKAYTAHQAPVHVSKKTLPGLSATAKAKDLELRFERLGNVNAGCVPEVVITPRGQLDLSAARALAFALAKEHISVLIWDRRGSGASSVWAPLTEASLPEQEVEDLKVLLDFVQTDRVVLVGLSSGARLSALFAAKYPSRVAGLAVLPTGDAAGAASVLAQAYYGDCREVAEQGGMEAIVATPGSQFHALAQREMQRRALLSVDVKEFVDVMLNSQVFIEDFIGEAFLGLYPEDLRQLQIPALVFHHGFKDDRLHVLEDAEEVARHLKTSLEDAADVEALQMALIAFVKSVAPAGGSGRPA